MRRNLRTAAPFAGLVPIVAMDQARFLSPFSLWFSIDCQWKMETLPLFLWHFDKE